MNRSPIAYTVVTLVALLAIGVETASAQTGCRKTLLQWSYGTSFEGGPDLNEPLVTDRPDFTEASVTVGYGVSQIEMGYTYTYDSDATTSSRQHSYPEVLLRQGMFADWFELRLDWNVGGLSETDVLGTNASATGAEDLGIGCKIALTPQESMLPETAIILQTSVPTGAAEFTAGEMLPGVSYLYGWEINDNWVTGGQTLLNRNLDAETADAYVLFSQSWTVGRKWTERIGSYSEWFCFVPSSADTDRTEHYFDGGFTVLLSNDLQWDIRAGVGLNEAADDYFVGSGLSIRFK